MSAAMVSRTGSDIATEIIMVFSTSCGPFLVVEGPTDERFFASRVVKDCYIAIGSGKSTVERAVAELEGHPGGENIPFVGVVDEDYDWLVGYNIPSPNVVKTDPRDLEGLLFRSRAFECVLAEYADRGAVKLFEVAQKKSVVESIVERAEPFGRIRMVNSLGPNVDLSKFKPVRFLSTGWSYDMVAAKGEAVALGVAPSIADLDEAMRGLTPPTPWHCVRGHDLIDILMGGLKIQLGAKSADRTGIERLLRQAFTDAEFAETDLHADLQRWSIARTALLA